MTSPGADIVIWTSFHEQQEDLYRLSFVLTFFCFSCRSEVNTAAKSRKKTSSSGTALVIVR